MASEGDLLTPPPGVLPWLQRDQASTVADQHQRQSQPPPAMGIAHLDPSIPSELRAAVLQHAACTLAVDLPLERHAIRCLFAELQPYPSTARRGVVGMGSSLAAKSAVVADAGIAWVSVGSHVVGLLQWGDSAFCLVGASGVTTADLSGVVDHAVRYCLRRGPTDHHVAVCNPSKVVGFWYELAYLPPQFGWPGDEIDRLLMGLSQEPQTSAMAMSAADSFPALPRANEPPVVAVFDGPATAARLLARAMAHQLNGYVAVNELHAPAGGVSCVLVLDGEPATVALQRLLASIEGVHVQPSPGIAAIVVRMSPEVQQAMGPNLKYAMQAARSVVVLQPPREKEQDKEPEAERELT